MKRKILSLILVFAMTVSLFTVGTGAVEPTYGDTAGHWAESSIERWSGHGIIQGSNGQFDPNGQLTCAQLATILAKLLKLPAAKDAGFTVFSHEAADAVQREFGLHAQEAYETLLYLQPSPPEVPACSIRPLTVEDAAEAARYYHLFDDPLPYLRGRAEAGALWGHFTAEGRLAGFLGIHSEGSMGMLEVVPEFRRRGIAQALEAALIRLHLERGWLPYCFVAPDNVPSLSLQAKLGLTNIHIPAIWLF